MKSSFPYLQSAFYMLSAVLFFLFFLEVHFQSDLYELLLVEFLGCTWDVAPYVVRSIVGLAWGCAFLLLLPHKSRKYIATAVVSVAFFTATFIAYKCYFVTDSPCEQGIAFYLRNPLQSLMYLFASFAFGIAGMLFFKNNYRLFADKIFAGIALFVVLASVVLSFIFNPLSIKVSVVNDAHKLPVELLYQTTHQPDKNLTKGKYIVAFMSYSCPYCHIAAKKFRVLQRLNKDIPFYIIAGGLPENEIKFFANTCAASLNHFRIKEENQDAFWKLSGSRLPAIYMIDNTIIYKQIHYSGLNKKEIESWLGKN